MLKCTIGGHHFESIGPGQDSLALFKSFLDMAMAHGPAKETNMESTQTRPEKRASINRRMRDMFLRHPMTPMSARVIRNTLGLPADTAITARIREIRNHPKDPMDIRCDRLALAEPTYVYIYYPADYVETADGDLPF